MKLGRGRSWTVFVSSRGLEGFDEKLMESSAIDRWGTPDDFEGAIIYLASKASDFVCGETLVVDGVSPHRQVLGLAHSCAITIGMDGKIKSKR